MGLLARGGAAKTVCVIACLADECGLRAQLTSTGKWRVS
jgi:hypothetical protein